MVYSGNDIQPFNIFIINSEYGSSSTFSIINLDRGVITRGSKGYLLSSQTEAKRFDLEIPDEVFEIRLTDNGTERFTAIRDFINEWIYFTFPSNQESGSIYKFPTRTLLYNYRDNSWSVLNESYTSYGSFRKSTGFTWATVGEVYPTWSSWNDAWNAGTSTLENPEIIAGNQQGFVLTRDDGTNEGNSLYIQDISGGIITSPDHSLNLGDYIQISGCLGTISSEVNGKIFSVGPPIDEDSFTLNPPIGSGTYLGEGKIKDFMFHLFKRNNFHLLGAFQERQD